MKTRELKAYEQSGSIAAALAGTGPALGFGEIASTSVAPEIAVVVGTSGTTGDPKEIGLAAKARIASADASHKFLKAQRGQVWSLLLPLTHIAGVNVLVRAHQLGTEVLDLRDHSGAYPHADFTAVVPTQLFKALNGDTDLLQHFAGAQAVLVGGAPISPSLKDQARAAGINIIITYGMTETSGGCVYNGRALDGVEIEIGEGKQIKIKGAVLAEGVARDGWFYTDDIGDITDGTLRVLGRRDDVIISGGENISLNSIESAITKEFPHLEVAAFATSDPQWGQALNLAIVGSKSEIEDSITQVLVNTLGNIAKPKGIYFIDSLPLIGVGKVDRAALAKIAKGN
jgi:O-succinylbenzoic acid--CoA ligase